MTVIRPPVGPKPHPGLGLHGALSWVPLSLLEGLWSPVLCAGTQCPSASALLRFRFLSASLHGLFPPVRSRGCPGRSVARFARCLPGHGCLLSLTPNPTESHIFFPSARLHTRWDEQPLSVFGRHSRPHSSSCLGPEWARACGSPRPFWARRAGRVCPTVLQSPPL